MCVVSVGGVKRGVCVWGDMFTCKGIVKGQVWEVSER